MNPFFRKIYAPPRFSGGLPEERQEKVLRNIQASLRCLGLMAQYDEERLRKPATTIRELWTMELLPPDEIETALASY
ncbi:MAG: hypothetical protein M5U11_13075 [Anaerolineales bacterium]|nr:hypothetical protein [Anaerolineales bacterium]GER80017.1 hypothetical protein DIM_20980 [Candidatus Denitrolinea symbiosum]